MLADDLADIPAPSLDKAIKQWVASSPYLPKASELRAQVKSDGKSKGMDERERQQALQQLCDAQNVELTMKDSNLRWVVDGSGCKLRDITPPEHVPPLSDAQLSRAHRFLGETILKMGINCGDVSEERAQRIREVSV